MSRGLFWTFLFGVWMISLHGVQAAGAQTLSTPPKNGGTPVLPPNALENIRLGSTPTRMIAVAGQPFKRALRVEVPPTDGETNRVQITINNALPVRQGDALLADFYARGSAKSGPAQLMFLFERNQNPWTKSITQGVTLREKTWRHIVLPFTAQENYKPGEVMTSLRLAFGRQTVEIADLKVLNFGTSKTLEELQEIAARRAPLGTVVVKIDRALKKQTMLGMGGNYTGGYRAAYGEPNDSVARYTKTHLDPAHARLGLSLVYWQPTAEGEFVERGKAGGVLTMAGEFARKKIPMVLSIWEAPEWMTITVDGKKIIPENHWDAAVNALAEFLVRARDQHGATIDYVSFNEADLGIDIYFTPERMAAFIRKAVPEFMRRGLKTKWLAGDTANGRNCVAWTRPQLADPETRKYLGPLAFHSWDALGASDADYQAIANLAREYDRPAWCLEAGHDAQAWQIQPSVWPTWDNALRLAQAYVKTIGVAEASVMDYWTYRNDYPLVSESGGEYPAFGVLRQFQSMFGSGTQMIAARADSDGVQAIAGTRGKTIHILLVNSGGPGTVKLTGLLTGARVRTEQSNKSGAGKNVAGKGFVAGNGSVSLAVTARSVIRVTVTAGI